MKNIKKLLLVAIIFSSSCFSCGAMGKRGACLAPRRILLKDSLYYNKYISETFANKSLGKKLGAVVIGGSLASLALTVWKTGGFVGGDLSLAFIPFLVGMGMGYEESSDLSQELKMFIDGIDSGDVKIIEDFDTQDVYICFNTNETSYEDALTRLNQVYCVQEQEKEKEEEL